MTHPPPPQPADEPDATAAGARQPAALTQPRRTQRPPLNRSRPACWWCGEPLDPDGYSRMFDRPACRLAWHRHWRVDHDRSAVDLPDQPPPDEARRIADALELELNQQEDRDG